MLSINIGISTYVTPNCAPYCTLVQQVCHSGGGDDDRQTTLSTDEDISRVKIVFVRIISSAFNCFHFNNLLYNFLLRFSFFSCYGQLALSWAKMLPTWRKLSALPHTLIFCSAICIGCHAKIITFFPASPKQALINLPTLPPPPPPYLPRAPCLVPHACTVIKRMQNSCFPKSAEHAFQQLCCRAIFLFSSRVGI